MLHRRNEWTKSSRLFFFLFAIIFDTILYHIRIFVKTEGRMIILDHGWDYTSDERLTNFRLWIKLEIFRIKFSLINLNFYSSLTHKHCLFGPFFITIYIPFFVTVFPASFFFSLTFKFIRDGTGEIKLWTGHNNHFHFLILIIHLKNNWDTSLKNYTRLWIDLACKNKKWKINFPFEFARVILKREIVSK